MKTATCNADMITLQGGQVQLSPRYCHGDDCKAYPCPHVKRWAKRHKVIGAVKIRGKAKVSGGGDHEPISGRC